MSFSKIFATVDKIEIGLQLLKSVLHPVLCIGVIIAFLKSFGNMLIFIDVLNIIASEYAIISDESFKRLLDILSYPVDLKTSAEDRVL